MQGLIGKYIGVYGGLLDSILELIGRICEKTFRNIKILRINDYVKKTLWK
jgi:hypothetical protein